MSMSRLPLDLRTEGCSYRDSIQRTFYNNQAAIFLSGEASAFQVLEKWPFPVGMSHSSMQWGQVAKRDTYMGLACVRIGLSVWLDYSSSDFSRRTAIGGGLAGTMPALNGSSRSMHVRSRAPRRCANIAISCFRVIGRCVIGSKKI